MTKARALAQGITLRRWRNMRYRTASGKERLAAYRQNALRATQAHKFRHRDFSDMIQPAPPEVKQALKNAQRKLRQLEIELHCREMRKIHSANAAARRVAKAIA